MRTARQYYTAILLSCFLLLAFGCNVTEYVPIHYPKGHVSGQIAAVDTLLIPVRYINGFGIYDTTNTFLGATDSNGVFDISLSRGTYNLIFRKQGYGDVTVRGIEVVGDPVTTQYLRGTLATLYMCDGPRDLIKGIHVYWSSSTNMTFTLAIDTFTHGTRTQQAHLRFFDHDPSKAIIPPTYEGLLEVYTEDSSVVAYTDTNTFKWLHTHVMPNTTIYAQACLANGRGYFDLALQTIVNNACGPWSDYFPVVIP